MDNEIINLKKGQNVDISIHSGRYPLGHNRYIRNYDIISAIGAFYFMITPLFVFLFIQS
jgi:hypothetical protein